MLGKMLNFLSLRKAYSEGISPLEVVDDIISRLANSTDPAIFIHTVSNEGLRSQAAAIENLDPTKHPLWGIPFVVKDNIDVSGIPTTAACPDYSYTPDNDATVIERLKHAGAIIVGKTNLDQFATGLNGTRSPYGSPRCVFNSDYISGGSSSGSAAAVASGLVAFSLGTDTAGSGRVPAAFNNIVGLKPTPGLISNTGVVPACRSIDVVSIFAGCVSDAVEVRKIIEGPDGKDGFCRKTAPVFLPMQMTIGVLAEDQREFFGNSEFAEVYRQTIEQAEKLGAKITTFDYSPFKEAASLLYDGPWVAERLAAVEYFMKTNSDSFEPTVASIIGKATTISAVDAFKGKYALEEIRAKISTVWENIDALLLPTVPTIHSVEDLLADPIAKNSQLGLYTNFANLLGYAGIAIPGGFTEKGFAAGATLFGPGFSDDTLAPFASALHDAAQCGMGIDKISSPTKINNSLLPPEMIQIAVVGAHLTDMPLNHELTSVGGRFFKATSTISGYRLFALDGTNPPKPGLIFDPQNSDSTIEVEIWTLPPAAFGDFVSKIPSPLGIGKLKLADDAIVSGFLCESHALKKATEITNFGGWRNYISKQQLQSDIN